MNLSLDIESYGKAILSLFGETDFKSKLSSITLEKGNDFTLAPFSCRKYGWANVEAELPALYVMGLREELVKDDGHCRWMMFKYAVEVYVSGDDVERLEQMTNRYARVITETLQVAYKDIGSVTAVDYTPIFKYEDALFKVCSMQFQLKVFQDLT